MSWSCTTYCERLDFKLSFRMQSKSPHWDETQNFPVQEIDFHVRVFIKWRRKSSKMSLLRESGEISTHAKHDNLPSYGALDYFQMHFIVMGRVRNPSELIAKCKAKTSGLFSKKHAIKVDWEGGKITEILSKDQQLDSYLRNVLLDEGKIYIDPLEDHVRVYGKWKHQQELRLYEELVQAMDRICYHVKGFVNQQD